MRRRLLKVLAIALVSVGLSSPVLADDGGRLATTLMGAGVGGYVGSLFGKGDGKLATTGAGVLVGGLIGNQIGRPTSNAGTYATTSYASPAYYSYSSYDDDYPVYRHRHVHRSYYYETYEPTYVAPPAPEPVSYIREDDDGQYCREFTQQVRIGNRIRESYGTACLQQDGSWRIVR